LVPGILYIFSYILQIIKYNILDMTPRRRKIYTLNEE
jgi:hypothetical protein